MLINDVNVEAGKVPLNARSPFLEGRCVADLDKLRAAGLCPTNEDLVASLTDQITYLGTMKGRRVIKTHLTFEFLPPKLLETCKVIYVARNPKDCAVSFYHHNLTVKGHSYIGDFDQFIRFFEEGLHVFGNYWQHVRGGWSRRHHDNVKFLWFEEMKVNQKSVIENLCDFLQHPLNDEQVNRLVEHVKFENMKNNPWANPASGLPLPSGEKGFEFMRKGQVGDWKNYFDDERNAKWKKWIVDNIKGTGLEELNLFKNLV